ncbi:unnamed protein product [Gordionus sp. m RMFG-2023]
MPANVLHEDENVLAITDKNPASKYHYLVMPKIHYPNIKHVSCNELGVVNNLVDVGFKILQQYNPDKSQIRMGFHKYPFNSIEHMHLHVIYPIKSLKLLQKLEFKPNTPWFTLVYKF